MIDCPGHEDVSEPQEHGDEGSIIRPELSWSEVVSKFCMGRSTVKSFKSKFFSLRHFY